MPVSLPADLYHLLSAELAHRGDYATLHNVIVSSKQLANAGAVNALYRIAHDSPLQGGGSDALSASEAWVVCMRWSTLWKTIILSSLGKTMYPYCRHLRVLDLNDLTQLLEEMDTTAHRTRVLKPFFAGELAKFHHTFDKSQKWRAGRLDWKKIVPAIGNQIVHASPLLEALYEPSTMQMLSDVLPAWAPSLSHLRELKLWDGKALADETLRDLLRIHCPKLDRLRIYLSTDSDSDSNLAAFISSMPENTLTLFENMTRAGIGAQTCLALNHHRDSLTELKLGLDEEGILALGLLQACTNLTTLTISQLQGSVDLKATQNDVYLEIVEWLKSCKSLKVLSFLNLVSAPDLTLPILLSPEVELESLDIGFDRSDSSMYAVKDQHDFHRAIGQQKSLRRLYLRADPEPGSRDDTDIMMNGFCSLENLRDLNLARISDFFTNEHLELLSRYLPLLEDLYIGGYGITDRVLQNLLQLKNLRNLTFNGLTSFTFEGLLAFVQGLDDSSMGFQLTIDNADPDTMLSSESQDLIKKILEDRLGGRFDYVPLRDPNIDEFNQSDSD